MAPRRRRAAFSQTGQASVELVALLPLLVLVAVLAWQLVVVGHAGWAAAGAARAGARAHAVGTRAADAARARLPEGLRDAARVTTAGDGTVTVVVRIPTLLPSAQLGTLSASARFEGGSQ